MPMRVTEDRKPETRTDQLPTGCLVPLFQPLRVDKGGMGSVVLWSLPRLIRLGERPHVTGFWDILGNSSSLRSGEALCYEIKRPRYQSQT